MSPTNLYDFAATGPSRAIEEPSMPASASRPVVLDTRVVHGSGGGPDKTILNSPRFLDQAGYHNLCAYMHPPGDPGFESLMQKAQTWQAPLLSVHDRGPWDWGVLKRMLQICRRERVAIWHGHDYKSNLIGLLLRPFWPMRLVTTVHGWVHWTRRTALYYEIDRLCLPRYDRVICVSEDLHERCLACGVAPGRCVVIENGIDSRQFARCVRPEEAKRRLGILPGRLVVGAIGRLSAEKGFDVLIQSVKRLLDAGLDLELLIAGEGNQRPQLEAQIHASGREGRIRLLGYLPDPMPVYEAMDVYALSSYREGLPNVLLEAMAMEIPVVATRVAGVPRLVRHEENGLLVEPGSAEALAAAIARPLRDADLASRLRRSGRTTVEVDYSFEARMRTIRSIYDDLMERDGHGSIPEVPHQP